MGRVILKNFWKPPAPVSYTHLNGKERIYSISMDSAVSQLKALLASLENDMNTTPE